ncbi:hypothetical protein TWF694_009842 [Orbilia ellipsospora]|uniref:Mitochondrial carrier protein n=1 Tax=Orbilia ellipsospora TaxID=2528407 RepID=A0AAV9XD89_9PEZI
MSGGVTTTGSVNIHNPSTAYPSPSSSSSISTSSIDHHYPHHSDESFNFSPDHDPHRHNFLNHSSDTDMPGRRSGSVDVPATQRMLAACSGSLLTSLIVTPLDVVRVRLQAQAYPPSPPTTTTTQSASALRGHQLPNQPFAFASTAHISRPVVAADLGVTSCCREVFWVSSTNELCLAYPNIPGSSSLTKSTESCLIESTASHRFTGTWEGLVKIARNEGLPSLYRGLSPTLLMSVPANVIYFTGYESLRYSNKSPISKLSDNMAPLIAGSLARTIAATVIAPLELFKTRLQAASHPKGVATAAGEAAGDSVSAFRQTIMSVRSMVAHEGVASLWRGLMLTLWRDVPFSGIYWWGYETVRGFLASERYGRKHHLGPIERHRVDNETLSQEEDKATFTDSFVAGATSGAVAAFVTTPFDVGKTRRQVWRAASDVAGDANTTTMMKSEGSMPKVLMEIYQTEGMRGLFRGCVPRMLKVAPACAIMISSYEIGKKYAMRMKEREARDRAH